MKRLDEKQENIVKHKTYIPLRLIKEYDQQSIISIFINHYFYKDAYEKLTKLKNIEVL